MKFFIILSLVLMLLSVSAAQAQGYYDIRPVNPINGTIDYSQPFQRFFQDGRVHTMNPSGSSGSYTSKIDHYGEYEVNSNGTKGNLIRKIDRRY